MASFLHLIKEIVVSLGRLGFSSLSESGFIPTMFFDQETKEFLWEFSSLSESGFIPTFSERN